METPEIEINVPLAIFGIDLDVAVAYDGKKISVKADLGDLLKQLGVFCSSRENG